MPPLLLHIPHSSTHIPFYDGFVIDENDIQHEILTLTDWYTDDLYASDKDTTVCAPFSRIFCDVERFSDDDQEIMSKYGMGALYEKTDDGRQMRMVTKEMRLAIFQNFYWPHHTMLNNAVNEQLKINKKAVIIDCHSFANTPFKRDLDQRENRPDINIGTDGFHTPDEFIHLTEDFFTSKGHRVGINWPYSGTMVPTEHYRKNQNVLSIMIEINRKLYLVEGTNIKSDHYLDVKKLISDYLNLVRGHFLL